MDVQQTPHVLGDFVPNYDLGIGNWTVVSQTRDGTQIVTLNQYEYLYMSYSYGVNYTARTEVGMQPWTSGGSPTMAGVVSIVISLPSTYRHNPTQPNTTTRSAHVL